MQERNRRVKRHKRTKKKQANKEEKLQTSPCKILKYMQYDLKVHINRFHLSVSKELFRSLAYPTVLLVSLTSFFLMYTMDIDENWENTKNAFQ